MNADISCALATIISMLPILVDDWLLRGIKAKNSALLAPAAVESSNLEPVTHIIEN